MSQRKIYEKLKEWKQDCKGKKALLIEGAMRIVKSTICEEFGKNEYDSYLLIDFAKKDREVEEYFEKYLNDLDTFFMLIQTHYKVKLTERKSLIIFGEVQMYPQARAAIKYLVADGRYDYLETGSLISIKIQMEFHEKFQKLRKSRGLTQEELAEALFVSRTAVSKWESGRGYPSIDSLKEISKYFSVSLDDLLSNEELLNAAEADNKQHQQHTRP